MQKRQSQQQQHFLAKNGQTFGPYSEEQLREFQVSGKIQQYSWIWDGNHQIWQTLDPPPPPPPGLEAAVGRSQQQSHASSSSQSLSASSIRHYESLKVICHDFNSVVSGSLSQVSEEGCELGTSLSETTPAFSNHKGLLMNLLDPKTGKTVNIKAQLCGVRRTPEGWAYALRWNGAPELS